MSEYDEWLRGLSDKDLWGLYEKYQERDKQPDSSEEIQSDIDDRIIHKDKLIAEMNRRGLFDKEPGRA